MLLNLTCFVEKGAKSNTVRPTNGYNIVNELTRIDSQGPRSLEQ